MLGFAGGSSVQFGQAVDEIVIIALDAVIHREVNNLQVFGHVMALHKPTCVAVGSAEEKHINFVQRKPVGEGQFGFAIETFVHVGYLVAGIARTVDKDDFRLWMVQEQADEFACRIACSADNSYFNHIYVCLISFLRATVLLFGDNQHQQKVDDDSREGRKYGYKRVNNTDDGGIEHKIICDAGTYTGQHASGARASEFLFFFHNVKIKYYSVRSCV